MLLVYCALSGIADFWTTQARYRGLRAWSKFESISQLFYNHTCFCRLLRPAYKPVDVSEAVGKDGCSYA